MNSSFTKKQKRQLSTAIISIGVFACIIATAIYHNDLQKQAGITYTEIYDIQRQSRQIIDSIMESESELLPVVESYSYFWTEDSIYVDVFFDDTLKGKRTYCIDISISGLIDQDYFRFQTITKPRYAKRTLRIGEDLDRMGLPRSRLTGSVSYLEAIQKDSGLVYEVYISIYESETFTGLANSAINSPFISANNFKDRSPDLFLKDFHWLDNSSGLKSRTYGLKRRWGNIRMWYLNDNRRYSGSYDRRGNKQGLFVWKYSNNRPLAECQFENNKIEELCIYRYDGSLAKHYKVHFFDPAPFEHKPNTVRYLFSIEKFNKKGNLQSSKVHDVDIEAYRVWDEYDMVDYCLYGAWEMKVAPSQREWDIERDSCYMNYYY